MNLRRNAIFGAAGFVVPTITLLAAYPVVLHRLGASAMGVYLLASTVSGSLAFLEFGVSTATMKLVAEHLGAGDRRGIADTIVVSLAFYGALGMLGLVTFWALAPVLARWSGAGPDLTPVAIVTFRIAALQFLPAYVNGVFGAVFKGLHRFEYSTGLASLLSILTWGGAAAATAFWGADLVHVAAISLCATCAVCLLSWRACAALCHSHGVRLGSGRPTRETLRRMLRFGIFMSVNGLAAVLMLQVQTWILAGLLGAVAVTVFSTGFQIVIKINALMSSTFEAMMPAAAALSVGRRAEGIHSLRQAYNKAFRLSLAGAMGASAVLYAVAPALIRWWLHSDIDAQVVTVVRILCVGLAINGATPVPYHLLNGIGKPEINSAFMILGTATTYLVLFVLSFGGLDVSRFSLATASSYFLNGVAYLLFCEMVVWRRWLIPKAALAPGTASP
jgi:O-antigen/teichoic acid export membrane protein